jgi:hypothetical protein
MPWLCASFAVQAINPNGGYIVGVSNRAEMVVGILALIDEVRTKMTGTKLAAFPWRPASPEAAEELADLATEARSRPKGGGRDESSSGQPEAADGGVLRARARRVGGQQARKRLDGDGVLRRAFRVDGAGGFHGRRERQSFRFGVRPAAVIDRSDQIAVRERELQQGVLAEGEGSEPAGFEQARVDPPPSERFSNDQRAASTGGGRPHDKIAHGAFRRSTAWKSTVGAPPAVPKQRRAPPGDAG